MAVVSLPIRRIRRRLPFAVSILLLAALTQALVAVVASAAYGLRIPSTAIQELREVLRLTRSEDGRGPSALFGSHDVEAIESSGLWKPFAIARLHYAFVRRGDRSAVVAGEMVNRHYFQVMRVQGLQGRAFGDEDSASDAAIVVSSRLASRLFNVGEVPLGHTLRVGDRDFVIIGTTPAQFGGIWSPSAGAVQFWVLLDQVRTRPLPGDNATADEIPDYGAFVVVARVPHSSQRSFSAGLKHLGAVLELDTPTERPESPRRFTGHPMDEILIHPNAHGLVLSILYASYAAVAALLLIVLVFIAVLFARDANASRRDLAVRTMLGAQPFQVVGEPVMTVTVLFMAAVPFAWAVSSAVLTALSQRFGEELLGFLHLRIRWTDILIAAVVGVIAALSGLAPSLWRSVATASPAQVPSETKGPRFKLYWVAAGVSVCLVLVTVASVITLQFRNLPKPSSTVPWNEIQIVGIDFGLLGAERQQLALSTDQLATVLASHSRVRAAAWVSSLGPGTWPFRHSIGREVLVLPSNHKMRAQVISVSRDWPDTLPLRLREGRLFYPVEHIGPADIAILTRSTAAAWWPGQPAVGKRFLVAAPGTPEFHKDDPCATECEVVGIVDDWFDHADDVWKTVYPVIVPAKVGRSANEYLLVRTSWPSGEAEASVERLIRQHIPGAPLRVVATYPRLFREDYTGAITLERSFRFLAVCSLAVATAGLGTLITDEMLRRRREFGIRAALGASSRHLVTQLSWEYAKALTLVGIVATIMTYWAANLLRRFLDVVFLRHLPNPLSTLDMLWPIWLTLLIVGVAVLVLIASRLGKVDPGAIIREGLESH